MTCSVLLPAGAAPSPVTPCSFLHDPRPVKTDQVDSVPYVSLVTDHSLGHQVIWKNIPPVTFLKKPLK